MKKIVFLLTVCALLVGCDKKTTTIQCDKYRIQYTISANGDNMHALINGNVLDLKRAIAASGSRYVGILNDIDVTLWGQGNKWTIFWGNNAPIECTPTKI